MKIHIAQKIVDGPFGGSHKFLGALKWYFQSMGLYEANPMKADIIMVSAFLDLPHVLRLKSKLPERSFVHRIDGPIRLYSSNFDIRDSIVSIANRVLADGTIFQSKWSEEQNRKMGFNRNLYETIITNAPDSRFFNRDRQRGLRPQKKIRLVATSWSGNWKKGFAVYRWLDENLDFSKIEMTFVGNSPVTFRNIRHLQPMTSKDLSSELKRNDIFITASEKDPCSNSLIEALHCGLPAIALRDGGHPELLGQAGELFYKTEEIPILVEKIATRYRYYQDSIRLPTLEDVGSQYHSFLQNIDIAVKKGRYRPKKMNRACYLQIRALLSGWRMLEKCRTLAKDISGNLFSCNSSTT